MNNSIVFLGDSLIQQGKWHKLLPNYNILNFGVSGDKTYDILSRLNSLTNFQPLKLFFMAGINDLGDKRKIDKIIKDYQTIVKNIINILPETKIFIISILPVNNIIRNNKIITHTSINILNNKIAQLSNKFNLVFINMNFAFSKADGQLKSELTTDGLHLNDKGYFLWKQIIEKYI